MNADDKMGVEDEGAGNERDDQMHDDNDAMRDDDDFEEEEQEQEDDGMEQDQTTEILRLVAAHGYKRTTGVEEIDAMHWAHAQLTEKRALGETDINGNFPIRRAPNEANEIFFEVILLYDEMRESDIIPEFSEDDRFFDHFQHAFPPLGPPVPWEENQPNKRYTLDNIRVFYRVWGESNKPFSSAMPDSRSSKRKRTNDGKRAAPSSSSSSSSLSSSGSPQVVYAEVQDLRSSLSSIMTRKNFWITGHRPIFHVIPKDSASIPTFTSQAASASKKRR